MPEVNVPSDPIIVYGMVGLFVVAILLAFFFSRSRRGLGAATKADSANTPHDEVWMPGGDIFAREPAAPPLPPPPPTFPTPFPPPVEPAFSDPLTGPLEYPPTDSPADQPAAHDPWSTTPDQSGQQPRWDRS